MRKTNILIVAKGSSGDVFPLYSLAQRLYHLGYNITLITESKHQNIVHTLNLPVIFLNSTKPLNNTKFFAQTPYAYSGKNLQLEVEILLKAGQQNDIIIGNQMAHFAPTIARKLGKTWVYCPVSPLAMPSYHEVSLFPYFHPLQRKTLNQLWIQNLCLFFIRQVTRLLMRPVEKQQKLLGDDRHLHPQFEGMYSSELNLFLTSSVLVTKQPNWPEKTIIAGFPWFDANLYNQTERTDKLNQFLNAGSAPVVFTLSSGLRGKTTPSPFFYESIKVCELLGIRGIIVVPPKFYTHIKVPKNILISHYLPYDILFSQAQAVVHSGGVGTIAWCLKHSLPSLAIPMRTDQFDNAFRLEKRGLGKTIFTRKYNASHIALLLSDLLENKQQPLLLKKASKIIDQEDGIRLACEQIEKLL